MPIAPSFEISQTDTHVCLNIAIRHVRVQTSAIEVVLTDEDTVVHVAAPPIYVLTLNFAPHQFRPDNDDDSSNNNDRRSVSAQFQPRNGGVLRIQLEKAVADYWDNLDLIGRLKQPPVARTKKNNRNNWLQEIIPNDEREEEETSATQNHDKVEEEPSSVAADTQIGRPQQQQQNYSYGFGRMFTGIFTDLARDGLAREMLEMPWPTTNDTDTDNDAILLSVKLDDDDDDDDMTNTNSIHERRRRQRREYENSKFSADRYLGDLDIADDYLYQTAMNLQPHWQRQRQQQRTHETDDDRKNTTTTKNTTCFEFSKRERLALASIPYPLLPSFALLDTTNKNRQRQYQHAWAVGMCDLLFAYVYDYLLMSGGGGGDADNNDNEPTVESAWTVSILSASLSWLDDWMVLTDNMNDCDDDDTDDECIRNSVLVDSVLHSSLRRALIYPYLRNFQFGLFVWQHVCDILLLQQQDGGIRVLIRCLLQLRSILHHSELYYLGNKLFVDPYLAWLQQVKDPDQLQQCVLMPLAKAIQQKLQSNNTEVLKESLGLGLIELEQSLFLETEDDNEKNSSCISQTSTSSSDDDDSDSDSDDSSSTSNSSSDSSDDDSTTTTNSSNRVKTDSTATTSKSETTNNLAKDLLGLRLGQNQPCWAVAADSTEQQNERSCITARTGTQTNKNAVTEKDDLEGTNQNTKSSPCLLIQEMDDDE